MPVRLTPSSNLSIHFYVGGNMLFHRPKSKSSIPQCVQGVQYYRQGNYEAAAAALEPYTQRQDLLGQTATFYYAMSCRSLGMAAMNGGAFTQAETWFRKALDVDDKNADLTNKLATVYARTDRPDRCAVEMQKVHRQHPDVDSTCRLALAQWRAGRAEQATITLIDGLRRHGPDADYCRQLALLAVSNNDFDQADKWLDEAIQADCTDWRSWRYKGLVAAAVGDLTEAVRAFHRASDLQPGNMEVLWQLSRAAASASQAGRKVSLALPEVRLAHEDTPLRHLANYIVFESDYLDACLHLPMDEKPEEYYSMLHMVVAMAMEMHPGYPDLYYHQSRILQRLDRLEEAIVHAQRAVEINPTYRQAWLQLSHLYVQTGRKVEAINALRRTIDTGGDWPDVHHLLGELYRGRQRKAAARKCYQRALTLNPDYHPAAEGLEQLAA